MPERTPSGCHQVLCRKKFTSGSWRHEQIELHHPDPFQIARQKNLTIGCAPLRVEPAQRGEFNANKGSDKDLAGFPYLKHVENIADSQFQPAPALTQRESYQGTGALLIHFIVEPCERDA